MKSSSGESGQPRPWLDRAKVGPAERKRRLAKQIKKVRRLARERLSERKIYGYLPVNVMAAWPALSNHAKAVVVALAYYLDPGEGGYPGYEKIMESSGIRNRSRIGEALKELEGSKLIVKNRRQGTSNYYEWTMKPKPRST